MGSGFASGAAQRHDSVKGLPAISQTVQACCDIIGLKTALIIFERGVALNSIIKHTLNVINADTTAEL